MSKTILNVLIVVLALIIVFSGFMIISEISKSEKEKENFESLSEIVTKPIETKPESSEEESIDEPVHKRNLGPLLEKNPDFIGWLSISGTNIDYPVVHTPYEPQKYLRMDFEGEYAMSGVPFLEGTRDLTDGHIIIYGHNMKNGTMFSDIIKYCEKSYCAEHPAIEWETKQGLKVYTVFAVVQVKDQDEWYRFITAADEEDYENRIKAISEASLYTSDIKPRYGQQLLTLSTCYGSSENDRLIVIAVEMN